MLLLGFMTRSCRQASPVVSLDPELQRLQHSADFDGVEALSDVELLTLLLGRSHRSPERAAARLLDEVGGLKGLSARRPQALVDLGLNPAVATYVAAGVELGRRSTLDGAQKFHLEPLDPERVSAWAIPRFARLDHEEVWVLSVDAQSRLRSTFQVGRGGIHGCSLLPRDVLGPVLRDSASGFVLVHNHPSGDPEPSPEDLELTRVLRSASALLGAPLLDHLIVAGGGSTSLLELGFFDSF